MSHHPSRPTRRQGTSLVEVTFAAGLALTALVPLLAGIASQARGSRALEGRIQAEALARQTLLALEAMPFEDLLTLRDDAPSGPQRSASRLPSSSELETGRLARRIEITGTAGTATDRRLQKATVRVRYQLSGEFAAPGDPSREVVLTRVLANRGHTFEHDGITR